MDYSMAAGNPLPQYYASTPLEAAVLDGMRGIFHGASKAPATMHLVNLMLMASTAASVGLYRICDYLLYYPFIDGDSTDTQTLDNTITLPRYTDGAGVRAILVAVAPTAGGGSFTFDYINQDGNPATAPTQLYSTTTAGITSLATAQPAVAGSTPGPFLQLNAGDTGVRQITAFTNITSTGGLLALVLVKPLADAVIREINTPTELPFVNNRPGAPQILDGAYLNFISLPGGSVAAAPLVGSATFAWSD
jgi:hypothetical protein